MKDKTILENYNISVKDLQHYNDFFGDTNFIHAEASLEKGKKKDIVVNGAYIISLINAFIGNHFKDGVKIHSQKIEYFMPTHCLDSLIIKYEFDYSDLFCKLTALGCVNGKTNFLLESIVIEP